MASKRRLCEALVLAALLTTTASAQLPSPGDILRSASKPGKTPPPPRTERAAPPSKEPARPGAAGSQGITGPMHAAHLGEIVFTRTDLAMNAIGEANLTNSFALGDEIFFRVYLRQPAVDTIVAAGATEPRERVAMFTHYRAQFSVVGQSFETTFERWGKAADHLTWTTWRGQLFNHDRNRRATVPGSEVLREFLGKATAKGLMGPGAHRVQMEIAPLTIDNDGRVTAQGAIVAAGEFTLNVTASSYNRNDPQICTFPAAQSNPALEQQILALAKRERDARATIVPAKVRVIQGEWTIERHPASGIILRRYIEAVTMGRGPQYCAYRGFTYTQPYAGGGFSAAMGSLGFAEFKEQPMPCQCLS